MKTITKYIFLLLILIVFDSYTQPITTCRSKLDSLSDLINKADLCNNLSQLNELNKSVIFIKNDIDICVKEDVTFALNLIKRIEAIIKKNEIDINQQRSTLIKQRFAQGDFKEAKKLLDECKNCLKKEEYDKFKQYMLTENELKEWNHLYIFNRGINKQTANILINNIRLRYRDSTINKEIKLQNIPNQKISPKETFIGGANYKRLVVEPLKNNALELEKVIRVPVYSFDSTETCVYYTNRNSTDTLFRKCNDGSLILFTFPRDSINAKWRVDELLPNENLLVVRQIDENNTTIKLLKYDISQTKKSRKDIVERNYSKKSKRDIETREIRLKEITSKTFNGKQYSEFKIIDTCQALYFSAFSSMSQSYDIFKFESKKMSNILLQNIENFKIADGKIVYVNNGNDSSYLNIQPLNSIGSDKFKRIGTVEKNFDLGKNQLVYWKKMESNSDMYEWELRIYDLVKNDNIRLEQPFSFISNIDNPPLLYAFDGKVICHDLTHKKYLYIDIENRTKIK